MHNVQSFHPKQAEMGDFRLVHCTKCIVEDRSGQISPSSLHIVQLSDRETQSLFATRESLAQLAAETQKNLATAGQVSL